MGVEEYIKQTQSKPIKVITYGLGYDGNTTTTKPNYKYTPIIRGIKMVLLTERG